MTGTDFQIEMLTDALNYHQNGDADDAPCCTAANPCESRVFVTARLAEITATPDLTPVAVDAPKVSSDSRNTRTGTTPQVQNPASGAQVSYIRKLADQHDTTQIGTFPARTLATILDGNAHTVSSKRASSLITVLRRQPRLVTAPDAPKATEKQLAFLRTLITERGNTVNEELLAKLGPRDASKLIDDLLTVRPITPRAAKGEALADGLYRRNGEIFKVQHAIHGSGRQYAKKLTQDADGDWSFQRSPGLLSLTADDRMTLDEAKEFGALYGTCACCGRTLTDEKSIAAGIGPVCAGRV